MTSPVFDAEAAAAQVVAALLPLADPERAVQASRYLKSDLDFLGVSVPGIRAVVTEADRTRPGLGRNEALAWARALWRERVHERRIAAIEVLRRHVRLLRPADLAHVEAWVREARGWAYVDPLAADIAGPIALLHPDAWTVIDAWAIDEDFWIRRSALLTLLPGIRRGGLDRERFERYATPMLTEKEFFIRKAIGWVLRETAKKDPAYVAAWTRSHLDRMSGVTFREAVRRLPAEQAARLQTVYRRPIGKLPFVRSKKAAGLVLAAGLAIGGLAAYVAGTATASPSTCGGSGSATTVNGKLADGATYLIQCPPGAWNGTLYLYSHGYVAPGSASPARDVGDPVTAAWMLGHGYALAGSSYASTGWAIAQALPDQVNTLDAFGSRYGQPKTTVAWGHSLGGIITAGLIQEYPKRFDAALPMCGVLSGGVATWNTALDAAFAFQKLIAPSVQIVSIADPAGNLKAAEAAGVQARQTKPGLARLALVSALGDTPGWFTPLSPEPAASDYATQEANQFEWGSQVTFAFAFAFRAELEARAGGNPSWNTGVNYAADLAKSADFKEVRALYRAAGLSLAQDLRTLDNAPRVKANPDAEAYLTKNISFNGSISVPVLTMHTTGDGLVVPENEQAYRSAVDRAGRGNLLRQVFVRRAGHCAFTPAETVTAVQTLENRLATGRWHVPSPAAMNARAAALGPQLNIFSTGGAVSPTAPAFLSYSPARYLRPFNLFP